MKSFATLIAPALFAASVTAQANDLQTQFNGPAIKLIVCPQAEYAPGAKAECSILLRADSDLAQAKLETTVWRGTNKLQTTTTLTDLKAGETKTETIEIQLPANEMRGYLITATLISEAVSDKASGYIESADSYLRYPRPATIGHPVKTVDAENQLTSWLAYGVNLPIYFDTAPA